MNFSKAILNLSLATLTLVVFASGRADVITGELWKVPDLVARNAILANLPATSPDVTFDVNSPLNFTTQGSVATFLGSGGAFNVVEDTPGTLASTLSNGVIGSVLYFTGVVAVATGQQFTVTHDDGLTLIIGGLDLGFNTGPTGPVQSVATYTGPSGTFPFELVYAECCAGTAKLQIDLPFSNTPTVPTVPEPATLALLGLGLAGLSFSRRKR